MAQETNTRAFLLTGDFTYLKGKSWALIPYPDTVLATILSYPVIRTILPTNIRCPLYPVSIISKPIDAFVIDGYYPTTPRRVDTILGSYGLRGCAATGNASLRFDDNRQSSLFAIPIAGYPLSKGMKIEVEQNGKRKPISIKTNPKESWGMAYVKVDKGPFTIQINDLSNTAWVAMGYPILVGRLDLMIYSLLDNYLSVSMLGLFVGMLLLIHCYLSHFLKKSRH